MVLKCLVSGGGTGGHVYPALAVVDALRRGREDGRFLYVGVSGRAEETLVTQAGYPLRYIKACGFPSKNRLFGWTRFFVLNGLGVLQSIVALLQFRPHLLLATGGYTCAPLLAAAVPLRVLSIISPRIVLVTQNVHPGRVMRLFGRFADLVVVGYPESARFFPAGRVRVIGHPIGRRIGSLTQSEARQELGLPEDASVILTVGGSQGSRVINQSVLRALPDLLADDQIWVLHITGKRGIGTYGLEEDSRAAVEELNLSDEESSRYRRFSYVNDMAPLYAASDLAVVRGGASSLAELAASGVPILVVPKHGLPDDHQVTNARWYVERGGGVMLSEDKIKEWTGAEFARYLRNLMQDPERLEMMSKKMGSLSSRDALQTIVEAIEGSLEEFGKA